MRDLDDTVFGDADEEKLKAGERELSEQLAAFKKKNVANAGLRVMAQAAAESISGDPSFLRFIANNVRHKILTKEPIDPVEKSWLIAVLDILFDNAEAARVVSGAQKRGAKKSGLRSLEVAAYVLNTIEHKGVTKVDEAIQAVAISHHLDKRTVSRYWAKWKHSMSQGLLFEGSETGESLTELVQRCLGENRRRKKGI